MDYLEKEIREIFKLISSYAVDFFNAKTPEDISKINRTLFIDKCHEGVYLAQDKIVVNLLGSEEKLRNIKKEIKNFKTGKHGKELKQSQPFRVLISNQNKTYKEILLFKGLADTIAWSMLSFDKIAIRSTQTGHEFHGYLIDKNIDSLITLVEKVKRESGKFCLINDITSCMGNGAGDLTCVVKDKGIIYQEIKTGKVNEEIMNFLDYFDEYGKSNPEIENIEEMQRMREDVATRKNFLEKHKDYIERIASIFDNKVKSRQFERTMNQMQRMANVKEYNEKGIGVDIRLDRYGKETGRKKIMQEAKEIKDEYFCDIIEKEFQHLSSLKSEFDILIFGKFLYFLISDNQMGGIFDLKSSKFVRKMNAKHMIFHAINGDECRYTLAKTKEDWFSAYDKELLVYKDLMVFDWTEQILKDSSLCPPYLFPIDKELIFDLLLERKSIFVYFDCERFVKFVKSENLDFLEMENSGKVAYGWSGIEFKSNKNDDFKITMGWGMLFRMMFEFQSIPSLLNQLIEVYYQEKKYN